MKKLFASLFLGIMVLVGSYSATEAAELVNGYEATNRVRFLMYSPIWLSGSLEMMPVRRPSSDTPLATFSSAPPARFSKISPRTRRSLEGGERRSMISPKVIRSKLFLPLDITYFLPFCLVGPKGSKIL